MYGSVTFIGQLVLLNNWHLVSINPELRLSALRLLSEFTHRISDSFLIILTGASTAAKRHFLNPAQKRNPWQ